MTGETSINILFDEANQQAVAYDGDQQIGECQYQLIEGANWAITHTGVRPEYNGRGIARLLVEEVIAQARQRGVRIAPICSYAAHLMRHKEQYQDVL